MSEFFGSVWWMLVTLGLLVTFHEYGHFWVARRLGVKVLRFSVGFGKALWSRIGRDGTEYVIAAIPLGGYVKFLDERELEQAATHQELKGAYNRQSVWTRIAVTAAGPVANLIFAVIAFWLMLVIGKPDYQAVIGRVDGIAAKAGFTTGDRITGIDAQRIDNWSDVSMALLRGAMEHRALTVNVVDAGGTERTRALPLDRLPGDADTTAAFRAIGLAPRHWQLPAVVGELSKDGAALPAGIKSGDKILSIGGEAVRDFADVPPLIQKQAAANHALTVTVQRASEILDITVQPKRGEDGQGKEVWLIGFSPAKAPAVPHDAVLRYGPLRAVPEAFAATWGGVRDTFDLIGKMVSGVASTKNLSGVIGIAQAANASASMGLAWFLNFLALISISLAVLNLLPIPVLDGGHLLYYLVELIRGKPVSERVQIAAQYAGLFLIVALMSLALYNDVFHLTGRG